MATLKWKNEFLVNSTTLGTQEKPTVTALKSGGFVIAWRDSGLTDSVIRFQRYDANGVKAGAETLVPSLHLGVGEEEDNPAIIGLDNGGFWISFDEAVDPVGEDIAGTRYDSSGGSPAVAGITTLGNGEFTPDFASLGANGTVAVWVDNSVNAGDIMMRGFNADGSQRFAAATVNTNSGGTQAMPQFQPAAAGNPAGNRFAVVWTDVGGTDIGDIRARVFNDAGAEVLAEFTVNFLPNDIQNEPAVAWLDNNKFVVAWTTQTISSNHQDGSGTAVKYAIFTVGAANPAILGERLANTTTAGNQSAPEVAALPDGGFVIAWVDQSGLGIDNFGSSIRLQAFNGAGDKMGAEILVNTTTNGDQADVSLATLADGRVVVTWRDDSATGGDTSGSAIRAQIVDPRDGLVNGTAGNDTLYGNEATGDEINGGNGVDTIFGLGGSDQIFGGAGDDTADGGRGDDSVFGEAGRDVLRGGLGDDEIYGGDGNDFCAGGLGADLLDGGEGSDFADYLLATSGVTMSLDGTLVATGEAAGDILVSIEWLRGANTAASGDNLRGNSGANLVQGMAGNDTLNGVAGNDSLTGGAGIDALTGGTGNDQFFYNAQSEGGDSITDFSSSGAGNDDCFKFLGTAFGALPSGALLANQFQSSTFDTAQSATVRFFYETDTRILRFDQDGSGGAFAPIVVATLQVGATMVLADISIY